MTSSLYSLIYFFYLLLVFRLLFIIHLIFLPRLSQIKHLPIGYMYYAYSLLFNSCISYLLKMSDLNTESPLAKTQFTYKHCIVEVSIYNFFINNIICIILILYIILLSINTFYSIGIL